ncbi:Amidohydrolase 2 family-containing protein [Strongyloides ratti]|uniref:2-amino-3-carboxymuconate-6-semialdehyde decarboxylase n=1 Tax=Strongyloides ratti TaxID=34506 RepID=A0A090L8Z0_STRRB|nr:Amidohydrolase 2 family-containing protein [Strongyloides ratti]CEF66216.1 Amidohydrolase 2 family-containing protein [Strongyloides ratti]
MFKSTSNYPKFDIHAHVLPKDIPDFEKQFGYGGFITLKTNDNYSDGSRDMIKNGQLFRTVQKNCFDTEARIKDMDNAKVNVQCISTVPVMFNYWAKPEDAEITSRFVNDDIYNQCQKYPDRLVPMGTLPLQNIELSIKVSWILINLL